MSKNLWVSPMVEGSFEKPQKDDSENILDSAILYGYEMQEGTALAVGAACLTASAGILGVTIAT